MTVLFKGNMTASIATVPTNIEVKIFNDFEVHAKFRSLGNEYIFKILRWIRTKPNVTNPITSYNKFAQLFLEVITGNPLKFGTIELNGGLNQTKDQEVELIKYATYQVIVCAEQMIIEYRRSLLDYCIFHREIGKCSTYTSYIHLVACHCLVHCNFHAPGVVFGTVEFFSARLGYDSSVLNSFTPFLDSNDEDVKADEESSELDVCYVLTNNTTQTDAVVDTQAIKELKN